MKLRIVPGVVAMAVAAVLSVVGLGLGSPAQASAGNAPSTMRLTLAGDFIQIVNDRTGKCADVTGASTSPGAPVQQWGCSGDSAQAFRPTDLGNGFFHLVNRNSALCLTVGSVDDRVRQQVCHDSFTGQMWQWRVADIAGTLNLVNAWAGQCLTLVPNTVKNGAAIETRFCSGTDSAKLWHAVPALHQTGTPEPLKPGESRDAMGPPRMDQTRRPHRTSAGTAKDPPSPRMPGCSGSIGGRPDRDPAPRQCA
jgi:ricin-type beta-trefoil lectin protein